MSYFPLNLLFDEVENDRIISCGATRQNTCEMCLMNGDMDGNAHLSECFDSSMVSEVASFTLRQWPRVADSGHWRGRIL
jgi:hypothetical protein